ncbi:MAG: hypothetical protein RL701_6093 [Pseudomonadota bacterium]
MDYNDIPAFLRVCETLSFTRAAELLGTQKSSISRSIKRLESELGVRLLQRTTRQLALTEAGQAFYERARGALTGLEDAAAAVRELGAAPSGTIRMTVPTDASVFGLAEAITTFVQKYPAVHVDVSLTGRVVDLVGEGYDLALRVGDLEDSSLVARRVGSTDMPLFAAPRYLAKHGVPKSVAELADHDCVLFRPRHGRLTWSLFEQATGVLHSVDVTGKVAADQLSFVLRACETGAGIALLPPTLAREFATRHELEEVLPGHYAKGRPLQIVLPSAAFVPTRVALLRDHLVEHLTRVASETRRECDAHHARRTRTVGAAKR